jgi:hypothetical protein
VSLKDRRFQPSVWEIAPQVWVAGAEVAFEATVRPALFEAGAEIVSVVADLSDLDGPAQVALKALGDGVYQLESQLEGPDEPGLKTISIQIEEATSLGPHWIGLSRTVLLAPPTDQTIFADGFGAAWTLGVAINVELALDSREQVYQGDTALEVEATNLTLEFLPQEPVEPNGYRALRFAFHPGTATIRGRGAFSILMNGNAGGLVRLIGGDAERIGVDLERQEW